MDERDLKEDVVDERLETVNSNHVESGVKQAEPGIYVEALERYPNDDSIDKKEEKKLVRKLDRRILPLLGICYFFYYVDKTTL